MKANNSNFNVAIIGFGKIGRIRYNVLKKKKFINKIYIYDLYKKNIHLRNFKNLDEIFKDKTVNSIFICTPNYLNAKFTIEALQNKKNVFCEKPPSLNSRELLKVIAAKKKK